MNLYTIGFAGKPAEKFFGMLRQHHIEKVVDIRLRPGGQLSGFAKQDDLAYFLRELLNCEYHHFELLAPTAEIIGDYRRDKDWQRYVYQFEALMDERGVPERLQPDFFAGKPCCLLCSEGAPEKCHRRLVAERLARYWPDVEVVHL